MNQFSKHNTEYDVIILGAGINGCSIAKELSKTGKSVLVIDKNTIGSGTSSKSSRLIHGGLRYLETFKFKLVREALKDRQLLLEKYPNLVVMKPFYLPMYKFSPRSAFTIWLGLKFYDVLSGKHKHFHSKIISRNEFIKNSPALKQDGLKAVFRYYDAKTDDIKLTKEIASKAVKFGSIIKENCVITSIMRNEHSFQIKTNDSVFLTKELVNATGPWIDEVNDKFHLNSRYRIRKISGIHLVLDKVLAQDLMFMQTSEKRIFFIIPELEKQHTLIGTTEREETEACDNIEVNEQDVLYLIKQLNNYLNPQNKIRMSNVVDKFIGIRPLISHKDNPTDLSREYRLDLDIKGSTKLLHIFGGKLTTSPSLAQKANQLLQ